MKKHVMAITYAPKEAAVQSGDCCQTIRKGDKVSVGDEILFHGWSGRPYRSPWSWRRQVVVSEVLPIRVRHNIGIELLGEWSRWSSQFVDDIAATDFIDPPTGIALRNVLFGYNNSINTTELTYQIIRW